jgi:hypothetical protein
MKDVEDSLPPKTESILRVEMRAALGIANSSDSKAEVAGGEGGAGGRGKKPTGKMARARLRGAVSGAGPSVNGGGRRDIHILPDVDVHASDVDVHGQPGMKLEEALLTSTEDGAAAAAEAGSTDVCTTISRRDANAFVRGVRRWGLVGRLDKIAAEQTALYTAASYCCTQSAKGCSLLSALHRTVLSG